MKQRNIEELMGKPLFSLTVDEFISLQGIKWKEENAINTFPEIMSIDIAAQYTGYKKSTLYRKTCSNTIPFYRQGHRVLFRKEDLEKWLLSDKQETVKEHIERLENELNNRSKSKRIS